MIDDCNHYEAEVLVKKIKPDLFFAGVRDKYIAQKMGIPAKQLQVTITADLMQDIPGL